MGNGSGSGGVTDERSQVSEETLKEDQEGEEWVVDAEITKCATHVVKWSLIREDVETGLAGYGHEFGSREGLFALSTIHVGVNIPNERYCTGGPRQSC